MFGENGGVLYIYWQRYGTHVGSVMIHALVVLYTYIGSVMVCD